MHAREALCKAGVKVSCKTSAVGVGRPTQVVDCVDINSRWKQIQNVGRVKLALQSRVKLLFCKYRGPSAVGKTDKNLRRQTKAQHVRLGSTKRSGRTCFTSVMLLSGGRPQLSAV